MRKLLMVFTLIILLAEVFPVMAQVPGPGGPYNSSFTVQNLESRDGTCVYTLYNAEGSPIFTSNATSIKANKSIFVYVGNLSVNPGLYSVVISCDVNVVAVSNYSSSNVVGAYGASYAGIPADQTATTVYFPSLYKNYHGYYSNIVVQNASSTSINVTLKIYRGVDLVDSEVKSVPPNASIVFDQKTRTVLPDGAYAGVVEATGPVAGMVNIWNSAGQQYAYSGFTSGSSVVYAPALMKSYHGFNTSLTVQNMGDREVTVTVTYSNGVTNTKVIPPRASYLFYTPNEPGIPNGWLGAAKVEAPGGTIVAVVNQSDIKNRAASYKCFATGGKTSYAPSVLKRYYGFSSSITCQNIGTAATNIIATYSNGVVESRSSIPPNGTALFYQPNNASLPEGFNGSAIITADQPIVCIINQNQVENPANYDFQVSYEGIVQQ
jgi:hypothetical protein